MFRKDNQDTPNKLPEKSNIYENHIFHRKEQDRTEQSLINISTAHLIKFRYLSFDRTHFSSFPASITIEAALILPIFIFLMYFMLFQLMIMESERKVQNTMETVGKQLAVTEYVQSIGQGLVKNDSKKEWMSLVTDGIEEGAGLAVIFAKATGEGRFRNLYFDSSTAVFSKEEDADSSMFFAELKYELELPFSIFHILPVEKSLIVNRRAWIGSSGGRGRTKYGGDEEMKEEETDRIVYLGKTSVVYHDNPHCHYLSNTLYSANAESVKDLRNENGSKYHACPSCKPGKSGTVYYFENGTAYHSSENCKAITAYTRTAHLSEVEGMSACSYCGRKGSGGK